MGKCSLCGSRVSKTDKKCPNCGKSIRMKLEKKGYSSVRFQLGRVVTDDDLNESSSIRKKRMTVVVQKVVGVKCSPCGTRNPRNTRSCKNCGANL